MPFQREVELTTHNATCRNGRKLRPADLLLPNFDAGKDLALDVTVSHPCQVAESPASEDKARSFLARKEKLKHTKYDSACDKEGWSFQAAAWNTWSGHSFSSAKLLRRLFQRATAALDPSARTPRLLQLSQNLALAVQRQVWAHSGFD